MESSGTTIQSHRYTPEKLTAETPSHGGLGEMIFRFKGLIFRFYVSFVDGRNPAITTWDV